MRLHILPSNQYRDRDGGEGKEGGREGNGEGDGAILESVEGLYLFLSTPTIPVNSFVSGVH